MICLVLSAGLVGCAPSNPTNEASTASERDGQVSKQPDSEIYKPVPLLWEGSVRDGLLWSAWVYQVIGAEIAPALLPGTRDVAAFCPTYHTLKDLQKANFWAFMISAIVKFESGFDIQADAEEEDESSRAGLVAGLKRLKGLMHISYSLAKKYEFCDFDEDADSQFDENDKRRAIFDPLKNLDCGMKILAVHIGQTKKITSENTPWKSLRPLGSKSHVREIQNATRALPFCK